MRSTLEAYLASLKGKKIAVIGIGISNTPLIKLLLRADLSVTACDRKMRKEFVGQIEELESLGASVRLGGDYLSGLEAFDVIFRTPGMRPDTPELEAARRAGAEVTSEMEVFFDVCPAHLIAVTGSDGKTTTTTIIAGLLKAAGYNTFLGGNIGHPLLSDASGMEPGDMVVLELSSFQLMTMKASPQTAVVTNLSPNHLDIHKSMQEYVAAKQNIYLHQTPDDKLVLNLDNDITRSFADSAVSQVTFFSRQSVLDDGVCVKDGAICVNGREVLPLSGILLPGVHNIENYMAAIAAVSGLVPDQIIRDYAGIFGGVEHRIELVRTLDGVRYYNDSIASSPSRTIAGLRAFSKKVILIAGGYDKHIPYQVLGPELVAHVKLLILTGATAPQIRAAAEGAPDYVSGAPEIQEYEEFRDAVLAARRAAQPGDVVILSPASASFDKFKNFAERGETFKQIIREL